MKTVKMLLHKGQFPLLITMGVLPIVLLLFASGAPAMLGYAWVLPAVYILLVLLSLMIPGKWRLIVAPLGLAAFAFGGVMLYPAMEEWPVMAVPMGFAGLFLWSLKMGSWSSEEELPFFWSWFGVAVHVGVQLAVFFLRQEGEAFSLIQPWLAYSFFLYILLVLLSLTRSTLVAAAREKQSASVSMKRKNILMILAFFLLALFIALIPSLIEAVSAFFQRIIQFFIKWLEDAPPMEASNGEVEGFNPTTLFPDEGETSPFFRLLSDVFQVVAYVIVAVCAVWLLYALGRWLIRYLKKLAGKFSRYAATVSADFEDEITDTRDRNGKSRRDRRKMRRRMLADDPNLPPGLRIRRNFLRLLQRNRQWSAGVTAREKLTPELATLYEQARYSDHPVTAEEAARFAAETRKL